MPLEYSPNREAIGRNIKTMMEVDGKPERQATAIALSIARRSGAKIPPPRRRYRDNAKISNGNP